MSGVRAAVAERALRQLGWCGKVLWADEFFGRLLGMTVRRRYDRDGVPIILILPRCRSVHTCGMRYPLDIAFCAEDGTVCALHEDVAPGRFLFEADASFVVERPSVIREGVSKSAAQMLAA